MTEDDAVGYLAEATDSSQVEVSGGSLTHCVCPTPVELERESGDGADGSIDQDHHEPSTCGCLICAVASAGKTPNFTVLNPTPPKPAVSTVDRLAFVAFCMARALVARGAGEPEALYEHYREAGDRAEAAVQAAEAARKADYALAFDRAAAYYRAALELAPESQACAGWTEALGQALAHAGRLGKYGA